MKEIKIKTKIEMKQITCKNCGAEVLFEPSTQMLICPYCGSSFDTNVIENVAESVKIIEPHGIIPFKVTKEMFQNMILYLLVIHYSDTPDDIIQSNIFDNIVGVYFPFYLFIGNYEAKWWGSIGYDRQEVYTAYEKRYDSEFGTYVTEPVTKTRTVTDWHPSSGEVPGNFSFIYFAGQIEKYLPPEYKEKAKEFFNGIFFDGKDVKDFSVNYVAGFCIENFELTPEHWEKAFESNLKNLITTRIHNSLPGDRQRDIRFNYTFTKEIFNVYLPFWIDIYDYKGEKLYIIINGYNYVSKPLILGKLIEEIEQKRAEKFLKGCLVFFLLAGSVVSLFFLDKVENTPWFILFLLLYLVTFIFVTSILIKGSKKFKEMERKKRARGYIIEKIKNGKIPLANIDSIYVKKCPKCGTENLSSLTSCANCGYNIANVSGTIKEQIILESEKEYLEKIIEKSKKNISSLKPLAQFSLIVFIILFGVLLSFGFIDSLWFWIPFGICFIFIIIYWSIKLSIKSLQKKLKNIIKKLSGC